LKGDPLPGSHPARTDSPWWPIAFRSPIHRRWHCAHWRAAAEPRIDRFAACRSRGRKSFPSLVAPVTGRSYPTDSPVGNSKPELGVPSIDRDKATDRARRFCAEIMPSLSNVRRAASEVFGKILRGGAGTVSRIRADRTLFATRLRPSADRVLRLFRKRLAS